MPASEIPRDKWPSFLKTFGDQHRGWPVTLEERRGCGRIVAAQNWALQQLSMDGAAPGHEQIAITVGEGERTRVTRIVADAKRLRVTTSGAEENVEIEDIDGVLTVVHIGEQ